MRKITLKKRLPSSLTKDAHISELNKSKSTVHSSIIVHPKIGSLPRGSFNYHPSINLSICSPTLISRRDKEQLIASPKLKHKMNSMSSLNQANQSNFNHNLFSGHMNNKMISFSHQYSSLRQKKSNTLSLDKQSRLLSKGIKGNIIMSKGNRALSNKNITTFSKETIINGDRLMKNTTFDSNSTMNRNNITKLKRLYTIKQLGLNFLNRNSHGDDNTNSNSNNKLKGRNKNFKQFKLRKVQSRKGIEEKKGTSEGKLIISTYDVNDDHIKEFYRIQNKNINDQLNKGNNGNYYGPHLLIKNSLMMNRFLDEAINC